ncbi:tetratricopeptide repeat protein [Acidobacteriota bacterium]
MGTLKGETYLLLGATYEKLNFKIMAMKFYCMAKEILGEGKTIQGLQLRQLRYYTVTCKTPSGIAVYVLIGQYGDGYGAYFSEDYEGAKVILENLVAEIDTLRGWESFRGETYLLLGATYEKLKYKDLAVKYYCKAKEILGDGKSIPGLELRKLKWYKVKCAGAAGVVVTSPRRRGGLGGIIGVLLGLAILGGLVWYLFINENSPLKKKDDDSGDTSGGASSASSACFTTHWSFHISSVWSGSIGSVDLTPVDTYPHPTENNNWDNTVQYTLSKSGGGTLVSVEFTAKVKVSGGDNVRRTDTVWVDSNQIFSKMHEFTQACGLANPVEFEEDVYTRNSLGTFSIRHKADLVDLFGRQLKNVEIVSTGTLKK